MKDRNLSFSGKTPWLSRRTLLRSTAGTMLGAICFIQSGSSLTITMTMTTASPRNASVPTPFQGASRHWHPMGSLFITIHSIRPIR